MANEKNRVCPVELAGSLDNGIRRWLQNPRKILGPYLRVGMIVLDIGCGPGFFSIDIAQMVGKSGRVIAADLQEGMLRKISEKVRGTELAERITLHQCQPDRIGVTEQVDFALAFYMVHEIPDQQQLFHEIAGILKPDGRMLIVEPPLHVSKKAFADMLTTAGRAGLVPTERPNICFSQTVILRKG